MLIAGAWSETYKCSILWEAKPQTSSVKMIWAHICTHECKVNLWVFFKVNVHFILVVQSFFPPSSVQLPNWMQNSPHSSRIKTQNSSSHIPDYAVLIISEVALESAAWWKHGSYRHIFKKIQLQKRSGLHPPWLAAFAAVGHWKED